MKKFLTLITVLFFATSFCFAQSVQEKDKIISFNIGFPPTFAWGKMKVPPISANFDYLIKKAGPGIIGVGGLIGFCVTQENFNYIFPDEYYKYTYLLFGARGTYHWFPGQNDKIDTYAGMNLGAKIVSSKYGGGNSPTMEANGSGVYGGPFIGIRYFFNPKFAANAEFGYGIAVLSFGASLKL